MKYKDLNHQNNHSRAGRAQYGLTLKVVVGILGLALFFWGLKLLVTPVVGAFASLLQDSTTSISYLLTQQKIRQEDGVTNFLIAGVDTRASGGQALTDTLILGSFRHTDNQISLISLPRDLWIQIPEFGQVAAHFTKINSAYSLGEQYNYPGGGIALLKQVLTEHLGIPIQYYALSDFVGFEQFVDNVGGVDVYVEQAFVDYQYPRAGFEDGPWAERWEVVDFEQGWQHMNGETALKYARSRHAYGLEGSDFARARRQQKVVVALKDKITASETLFNPNRLKELYLTFNHQVQTDVGLTEIPLIYNTAQQASDLSQVQSHVLDNNPYDEDGLLYVPDASNFGGAFVLLPREGWETVQEFIRDTLYLPEQL